MSETPAHLVIDSSVVAKWFLREGESDVEGALALLEAHRDGSRLLAAPEHLLLEVLNALKSRGLAETDLGVAASALLATDIGLVPVSTLVEAAASIAVRDGLTLYDAAFVALAEELDAELITADRKLADSDACRTRLLGT